MLTAAAHAQIDKLTLTSRAFDHELLEPFAARLAALIGPLVAGPPMVLPMNTGAEAVETAIKAARKWGYDVKGVPADRATIIVADGNFHGRTTTIVSFSTDPDARRGFGPYTPGFRVVPYGAVEALRDAIDETTVAVLLEPIQGEQGVVVPPADYLPGVRALCTAHDVLLHRRRDPVRARPHGHHARVRALGREARPGHPGQGARRRGAARVGRRRPRPTCSASSPRAPTGPRSAATRWRARSASRSSACWRPASCRRAPRRSGSSWGARLDALVDAGLLASSRRVGLWAGLDVAEGRGTGRQLCERLLARGVLAKDTHGSTIRLAPPLTISTEDLHLATDRLDGRPALTTHRRPHGRGCSSDHFLGRSATCTTATSEHVAARATQMLRTSAGVS